MTGGGARTLLIANPGADLYGSDRMVLETVAAARAGGWRVVVSVPDDGPLVAEVIALDAEVTHCVTPVVRKSALSPAGLILLAWSMIRGVRPALALLRRVRPDVLYVSTITAPLWFFVARLVRTPVVCHIHEGEGSASPVVLRGLNAPLLLADRLVINSRFSRDVLARAYPRLAARARIIYNSVPGPESVVASRETIDADPRLVFVGRLSPRKGPDVAIDALARLRDRGVRATLDIVGAVFPGYEWFERQLIGQVSSLGLADQVSFRGFQRDAWQFLAAADIAIVPSTSDEPFGNTAVEAGLAARPLIVSDLAGLKEASEGLTAAVRVRPASAEAIAGAVEKIVADWSSYRLAAADDRDVATKRYSRARYGAQVLAELESAGR